MSKTVSVPSREQHIYPGSTREYGYEYLPGWETGALNKDERRHSSLIVPTYCRTNEVLSLLKGLCAHEPNDIPEEVVVVDGSRDTETECALREWGSKGELPFRLRYVRSSPGLTRQKNVGVDVSSGSYLFFLDDDTRPLSGYFREMRAVFDEDKDGEIGAASGAIVNEMDKRSSFRWRVRKALGLVGTKEPMHYDASCISLPIAFAKEFSGTKSVDLVSGGASCFRREVFQTFRFSSFFEGYSNGEDVEMSLRVGRQFRLVWCGSARLTHHHAASGRPPGFARGRMDVRNRLFIRTRFWPSPPLLSSVRFWADVILLVMIDLALFVRHPRNSYLLGHAAGVCWATLESVFSRPRFTEPPAVPRYALLRSAAAAR